MNEHIREVRREGNILIVVPSGEIDLNCSRELFEEMEALCQDKPSRFIIDLGSVSYMDSSGVSTLIEMFRIVNTYKGRFVLVSPQPRVRSMLEIAKLDKFFTIVDSIQEARTR